VFVNSTMPEHLLQEGNTDIIFKARISDWQHGWYCHV
jgi:hypothetical protein